MLYPSANELCDLNNETTLFQVRIIVSVLYTVLTPLLNPVIYSLRNKELRDAIKSTFCRRPFLAAKRLINTVYP